MLFWQFSNKIIYVKIVGKIPDHHLNVWLFSNPGDKVQILVESTGQICPDGGGRGRLLFAWICKVGKTK